MKQRILFVDDETNVLEGLRRLLRAQRQLWDMDFATSGQEALAKLAANPFDVIVTDLMMPGLNGADLLEEVKKRWPQIARIALSGHADEAMTTRAMRLVHQYLHKPSDSETIKAAVASACRAQSGLQDGRMRATVMGCEVLPSPPTVCVELTRAVESERSDSRQIGAIISRDVAIAAKILQLVNSSFFGLGRRVSSVEQTVTLLGVVRIRALVLAEHLLKKFSPPAELVEFSTGQFWTHAMMVGEVARLITKSEGQTGDRPDQAFTAGLLHDIGKLVLASRDPASYRQVLTAAEEGHEPVIAAETRLLGISHAEIGSNLLQAWGLPERVVEAIAFHHEPAKLEAREFCALSAVHAANALVAHVERGNDLGSEAPVEWLNLDYLRECGCFEHLPVWKKVVAEAWEKQSSSAAAQ